MSRKRRNTSSPEPEGSAEETASNRRDAIEPEAPWSDDDEDVREVPQFDESSGQVGAFPGLGNPHAALFYGPAEDGIDYLRMVRSEARGVPQILTSSARQTNVAEPTGDENTKDAEEGGYYHDGAYTATAAPSSAQQNPHSPTQTRYYETLLVQFRLVRATLRCSPPLEQVAKLRPSQLISFPEDSPPVRSRWEAHILSDDPNPVQVACMDSDTVAKLLTFVAERLDSMLQQKDPEVVSRIGSWLWSLLGKHRDCGELSSEEVGEIRTLAREALRLHEHWLGTLSLPAGGEEEHSVNLTGTSVGEQHGTSAFDLSDGAVDNKETTRPIQPGIAPGECTNRIQMMLDMVTTIVGEAYGQRDLLELRIPWETV